MDLLPQQAPRLLRVSYSGLGEIRTGWTHEHADRGGVGNHFVQRPASNTIGIVVVAALAASAAGALVAANTATRRPTRSAASEDNRSLCSSAQRYSIATFCPST
jgi:hypothetical protein